jgi:hypothetical protein
MIATQIADVLVAICADVENVVIVPMAGDTGVAPVSKLFPTLVSAFRGMVRVSASPPHPWWVLHGAIARESSITS